VVEKKKKKKRGGVLQLFLMVVEIGGVALTSITVVLAPVTFYDNVITLLAALVIVAMVQPYRVL
jgi:hypothetical protein